MADLITRTKLLPPRRRSDLFSRPRLLELLSELMNHKLIILVAPAGYGKTHALIDFAHHTDLPICWYALDPLDRDPQRFFAHVIASIAQHFPNFGAATNSALQTFADGQANLDQFITTMVNELYDTVSEDFLLVIDDYHLVAEVEEIGQFCSQFAQQANENCHLLLASRRLLALPDMALMVARGYVAGFDYEDLIFTREELQQLILQNYGQSLSDREAAELVGATEGWITGLLLSTQSKLRNIPERMRRLRAAGVNLYDYLAQQVLDQQPDSIRDFLLRSAMLEEFDGALCSAVFKADWLPPGQSWGDLIDEVLRLNLFAVYVGEEGNWVRYNRLFQTFLQKQLGKERPNEQAEILRRLAVVATAQRDWERAHSCYHRLGDAEAIADLIEVAGLPLLQNGRTLLLAEWLEGLPTKLLQARPRLLSLKGDVLGRQGDVQQALNVLNLAVSALRTEAALTHLSRTLTRRAVIHRLLGDYQASLADCDQALSLLDQNRHLNAEMLPLKAHALLSKGMSFLATGDFLLSIQCFQASLELYQSLQDRPSTAIVSMELALVYMNMGHYTQALGLFEYCLDTQRGLANLSAQAIVLNNLGVLYYLQGKYVEALTRLSEAQDCALRSAYTRVVGAALISLGDLFADLELWETARKAYKQALNLAQRIGERFLLVYVELALARLAGAVGEWRLAFEHLSTASQRVADRKSGYEWALYQLAFGRYYLEQGKAQESIVPLLEAQTSFAAGGQPSEEATTHFYLAAAWHAVGVAEQSLAHGERGLALAFALENRHALLVGLRSVKPLLQTLPLTGEQARQAKQLTSEVETFERQIPLLARQVRERAAATLADLLAETPPRLLIRALGHSEVTLDGKPITNREWQTQISRDIFFCVLAHPNGLTREEVGGLFWPDASPSEVKTRFKNSVYRLRSALSPDVILFDDEIYRFNRLFDYEYDVERFLDTVAVGDAASDPAQRIAAYTTAVQLYQGAYLPEVEGAWVWTERQHLHQIFTNTILTLAELQLEMGDYRTALQSCQRALADDSCLEEAHRLAMRIYAAMGSRAGVARQYAQCEQALHNELDVPPSPQTTELYELLMRA